MNLAPETTPKQIQAVRRPFGAAGLAIGDLHISARGTILSERAMEPAPSGGLVAPMPVAKTVMVEPSPAGWRGMVRAVLSTILIVRDGLDQNRAAE